MQLHLKPCHFQEKPTRECLLCNKKIAGGKLRRHQRRKHSDHPDVRHAIRLEKANRHWEASGIFQKLRKEAMKKINIDEASRDKPQYQRERRQGEGPLVMCKVCSGLYGKATFAKHRSKHCLPHAAAIPIEVYGSKGSSYSDTFREMVLGRFNNDRVGQICKSDETLKKIGSRFFAKANCKGKNFIMDCARVVRTDMRRLAHIRIEMEAIFDHDICIIDIFRRRNIDTLHMAINNYCQTESAERSTKAGLKYALQFLLKRAANSLMELRFKEEKDEEAKELRKWIRAFHGERNIAFGDAIYLLNLDSQRKMRMPESLPSHDAIQSVRDESLKIIKSVVEDPFHLPVRHSFVKLRNAVVTRLTLFNGKRGGEPARLTLEQYEEMAKDKWIQKDDPRYRDDEYVQFLTQNMKATFQMVKGQNFVPVYFPKDTFEACRQLASTEFREIGQVNTNNPYLFPAARHTSDLGHVQGNQALEFMCKEAKLPADASFTFTANRHRISTLYAALDVADENRELFFTGLGHSKVMNEKRYQAPEALRGIATVATHLQEIDRGQSYFFNRWR